MADEGVGEGEVRLGGGFGVEDKVQTLWVFIIQHPLIITALRHVECRTSVVWVLGQFGGGNCQRKNMDTGG